MQQHIAHFQILEEIGRGGMGIVYKARDVRLQRYVAIKILPSDLVVKKKNLQRFIHEARTASVLNHPNICTIYDIGQTDEIHYIVMELIEGETLRQILNRKCALPEQEVIEIGLKICDALHAAHSKGIIHRDIKPENIMISRDGFVKVMDFGLAKLKNAESEVLVEIEAYPSKPDTRSSMSGLMGTASYMSPEQIERKKLDERTDIFSLGIVLYEMLTGQPPFCGFDNIAIMESILNENPKSLIASRRTKTKELDRIILKALDKNLDQRYLIVSEFYAELEQLQKAQAKRRDRMNRIASVSLVIALILVGFLSIFVFPKKKEIPLPPSPKFYPIGRTFETEFFPSFSPDGNTIAYIPVNLRNMMGSSIHFREIKSGNVKALSEFLSDTDWSPDGTKIVGATGNQGIIIIVDTSGTNKFALSDFGSKPKWSPNGRYIVFSTLDAATCIGSDNAIHLYDLADSSLRQISPNNGLKFDDPEWSPDSRRVICVAGEGSIYELWSIQLETGTAFPLSDYKSWITNPVWSSCGKFIYFISNKNGPKTAWRVTIDINQGKLASDPLLIPVGSNISRMDISLDGKKMIFVRQEIKEKLWRIPLSIARSNSFSGAELLMSNLGATENIEVSSDGASLVVETLFGGIRTLMFKSLMDSTETVLYREQPAFAPSWSADGNWIAFDAGGGNNADIWRISANGGPAEKIIEYPGADWMPTYSPDGNYLCFLSNRSGQFELWIKNLVSGEISQITHSSAVKSRGFWSHDSKKLAYIQKPNRICIYDFASRKAEEFVYLPNWQSGNDTVHKLAWKEDDSSLYFFTFLAMQERWGNALIEISLENKRQRIVLRSQKEMTLSHMTFSIFKGDIYFLIHETMDDIWLAEGLQ